MYLFALIAGSVAWAMHSSTKMGSADRLGAKAALILFLLVYFAAPAVFGARIEVTEEGLRVEQWSRSLIAYSEITHCRGFYLFPWQVVVLTTRRRFPLNVLFSGDRLAGKRRSPVQDGELALQIRSRVGIRS
jgi:uncharacterized protein (DUF2342 family)